MGFYSVFFLLSVLGAGQSPVSCGVAVRDFYAFGIHGGGGDETNSGATEPPPGAPGRVFADEAGPGDYDEYVETLLGPLAYPIFGKFYAEAYVQGNGIIEFEDSSSSYSQGDCDYSSDYGGLYPYWAKAEMTYGGAVFRRVSTAAEELDRNAEEIAAACREVCNVPATAAHGHGELKRKAPAAAPSIHGRGHHEVQEPNPTCLADEDLLLPARGGSCHFGYKPVALFIVTWYRMPYYQACTVNLPTTFRNTYQLILSTDGFTTYVLYYYNAVEWSTGEEGSCGNLNQAGGFGNPASAGLQDAEGNIYNIQGSCSEEVLLLPTTSNVGREGVYAFRIDQAIQDVCGVHLPLSSSAGGKKNLSLSNFRES